MPGRILLRMKRRLRSDALKGDTTYTDGSLPAESIGSGVQDLEPQTLTPKTDM